MYALPPVPRTDTASEPAWAALRPEPERSTARMLRNRLGDKWSLAILFKLSGGSVRFNALRRRIPDISQRVLTTTLRGLERDGFVERIVFDGPSVQVSYRLSALGEEIVALGSHLIDWASRRDHRIRMAQERYDREAGAA